MATSLAQCAACCSTEQPGTELDGLVLRCGRCRFGWTATQLGPVEGLYDDTYFRGDGLADFYDLTALRYSSARRLRWMLSGPRPRSLVEAGCATGFFVAGARAAGIAAHGVEVSTDAVRYATDVLRVPVTQGRFEAVAPVAVDAVCAFHVLEHVEDPAEFLDAARRHLQPGGRLYIEVPNIASAASRRLGRSWPGLQPRYHRWHFTPTSLSTLINRCGLTVERRDTVFSRYYWRPGARWRNPRPLLLADWWASGSPWPRHPSLGDAIRLVARTTAVPAARTGDGSENGEQR